MIRISSEPRSEISRLSKFKTYGIGLLIIVALLSIIFMIVGVNPRQAMIKISVSSFQSSYAMSEALVKTIPIIFTGLAVAIGLKMKLWNIGAEGQLYMGAFGAFLIAQTFPDLPKIVLLPMMIISAMIAGGLWGWLPGIMKKNLKVNEILTSLMLNYVAISWMNYLIYGPWKDSQNPGFPVTAPISATARLPQFFNTRLHAGLFISLFAGFLLWFLIEKTSWGYEIRAIGESSESAKYAGMPIDKNIVVVFIICGALAGIAGMCQISGLQYKLQPNNLSSNYGSLGIIVAWLSNANPLGVIGVSFIAGVMLMNAENLQITMGVSSDMVQIIIGLILTNVLICQFFVNNRIYVKNKEGELVND